MVRVNPRVIVHTGPVFQLHDSLYDVSPLGLEDMDNVKDAEDFEIWLKGQRNDLTKVAREDSIAPVIGDVIDALRPNAVDTDMSGSGSTCWALFWDEATATACADQIKAAHPDWWVQATAIAS